ncbi:SDR family NAD(P)-dependent oxidoreductase [Sphingomonas naphthae]|uniref:SDR family NAD(P)-dependent oxidoreductase n=1 Tax=Sphingomonas naphthae TaxID=1813468 RepID=A0ABY7TL70_9SPHN|nr:SDR family NAD(P)-dependent oxidoreductase [Sphingomonas naphthae]WCT73452.1 SDR family NAD(P)-dependent oxidoreductase [Sphingomonas naphthae]
MTTSLAGRVALVTGASSGIGAAAALALAEAGARVAMSARRGDRLAALVARIEAAGGEALAITSDVADEASATGAVEATIAHFGRIDILVNSAGIIQAGGIEGTNLDEYRRVMDVNLMGTVYSCRAAIPAMKAQGFGDIINISSQAGRKSASVFNAYSASKHALNSMSDAMRQEVGQSGIRVCVLMPGATSTDVADGMSDPAMRDMMKAHVTKDGAVSPAEIAAGVVFVAALPPHVNVDLFSIRPTIDTSA